MRFSEIVFKSLAARMESMIGINFALVSVDTVMAF